MNTKDTTYPASEVYLISPVTFITGLTAGTQYIVPGGLINDQLVIDYKSAPLVINPAPLTVTVEDTSVTYGDTLYIASQYSEIPGQFRWFRTPG